MLVVIHIDSQFTRDLYLGKPVAGAGNRRWAQFQYGADCSELRSVRLSVGLMSSGAQTTSSCRTAGADADHVPGLIRILKAAGSSFPGIAGLLTLVVTMMVTALSVAREREQGTFDQLLVTPFTPVQILIGKSLPGFIIGFFEATFLIITVAVFWFKIPLRGHLVTLYTGLSLFLLSSVGVGLMISSIAVTMQQGLLGAFLFLVPSITLSGFTTPIENMPAWIQYLTLLNPMRYFIVILRSTFLEGAAFEQFDSASSGQWGLLVSFV